MISSVGFKCRADIIAETSTPAIPAERSRKRGAKMEFKRLKPEGEEGEKAKEE